MVADPDSLTMTLTQLRLAITQDQGFPGNGSLAAYNAMSSEQKTHMINACIRRIAVSPGDFPPEVVEQAVIFSSIGGVQDPSAFTFPG